MRRIMLPVIALALLTPGTAAAQQAGLLLGTASDSTIFRAREGVLTDRLAVVPLNAADIVLVQWALGASVARWDRILAPALGPVRSLRR